MPAVPAPRFLYPGQEESLEPNGVSETGHSHRVLCLHPKGERQLMARGSVIESSHPVAPGGPCRWERDRAARRDPASEKGLSPGSSIPHCKMGEKKGEKCQGPATRAATVPGLCAPVHMSHHDDADAAGETEAGARPT